MKGCELLDMGLESNMKKNLENLTNLMDEVAAEVFPVGSSERGATPWVTAEIRQLRRERNRFRRVMTRRRGEWMEKCRELKVKAREDKIEVWRRQLSKIQEEKNISRAWRVVKGLKGEKQDEHGGAMLYEMRWRVTQKSQVNAFMQEYSNITKAKPFCDLWRRRRVASLSAFFKIDSLVDHPVRGLFPAQYVLRRPTRGALAAHSRSFEMPRSRTVQFSRSFVLSCVRLWNGLHESVFAGEGLGAFKTSVNRFLLQG